jgi:prepilin-type processing-associated H-X9-DG protein
MAVSPSGVSHQHYLAGDYTAPSEITFGPPGSTFARIRNTSSIKTSKIRSPERLVAMFDKGIDSVGRLGTWAIRVDEIQTFRGWHNGGKNFLFFDGHVEFVDERTLNAHIPPYVRPGPLGFGSLYDSLEPNYGHYRIMLDFN